MPAHERHADCRVVHLSRRGRAVGAGAVKTGRHIDQAVPHRRSDDSGDARRHGVGAPDLARAGHAVSRAPRSLRGSSARRHSSSTRARWRTRIASIASGRPGKLRGPLHGIPIALKDNIHTTDMPTTGGALAFAGLMPPYEATLTKNLRDAGAIIIAKTGLTELANWVAGAPNPMPGNYNAVGGYGYNPYDPRPRPARGDLRRTRRLADRRLELRHRHRGQPVGGKCRHRHRRFGDQSGRTPTCWSASARRSDASAATA